MADIYDLIIDQGATFSLPFVIEGINLTGYSARSQGRSTHASNTIAITFTATVSYSSPNSTILLSLTATQTAALVAPSTGVYDVEYFLGATVVRVVQGKYTITPEVTR
jgi:hypothetical protein